MSEHSATSYVAIPVNGTNKKEAENEARRTAAERLQCTVNDLETVDAKFVRTREPEPKSEANPLGDPGDFEYRATFRHTWQDEEPKLVSSDTRDLKDSEEED